MLLLKKDANITTLDVEIATDDGYVFEPSSNRGRIYYSNYALGQNVLSGGIIKPVTATQSFSLEFNPKTGVEDVWNEIINQYNQAGYEITVD